MFNSLLVSYLKPKWEILQGISMLDLLLIPPVIGLSLFFAFIYQQRLKDGDPTKFYILPALTIKLFGALLFAAIYNYYYAGGDTFWYYDVSKPFSAAWKDNPLVGIKLFFLPKAAYTADTWEYTSRIWTLFFARDDSETIFMAKIIGLVEGLGFESYWLTTIIFSMLCFSGTWKLFQLFAYRYPEVQRPLALSILFVPSALFWGSGILKDTVCLGALGWFVFSFDRLFSKNNSKLIHLLICLLTGKIILSLKAYIVLAFLPAGIYWIYDRFKPNSDGIILKYALLPFFAAAVFAFATIVISNLAANTVKYSPTNIEERAEGFRTYHTYLAEKQGQSHYSLGEVSYTPIGILAKTPAAINVTYFRPYPWEVNEPLQYISSIESLTIFFYFIFILYQVGISRFFRIARGNPETVMCVLYSVIIGIIVGLTAYNFGALVRFKIPGVPFLLVALAIIHSIGKSQIAAEKAEKHQLKRA